MLQDWPEAPRKDWGPIVLSKKTITVPKGLPSMCTEGIGRYNHHLVLPTLEQWESYDQGDNQWSQLISLPGPCQVLYSVRRVLSRDLKEGNVAAVGIFKGSFQGCAPPRTHLRLTVVHWLQLKHALKCFSSIRVFIFHGLHELTQWVRTRIRTQESWVLVPCSTTDRPWFCSTPFWTKCLCGPQLKRRQFYFPPDFTKPRLYESFVSVLRLL